MGPAKGSREVRAAEFVSKIPQIKDMVTPAAQNPPVSAGQLSLVGIIHVNAGGLMMIMRLVFAVRLLPSWHLPSQLSSDTRVPRKGHGQWFALVY